LLLRTAALVDRLEAITREGVVLAPASVAALSKAQAPRSTAIAIAVFTIAAMLLFILLTGV
jgi:ubiquinone biosynthesis protein